MGRSRRKVRNKRSFTRGVPPQQQLSGDLFLVVCEGAKTEPAYFDGLKREWRIPAARVEVYGEECGSDPVSVVNFAEEKRKERNRGVKQGESVAFSEVRCVIDRDEHPRYKDALDLAKAKKIQVAHSDPCFEFWYLLHFKYTTSPFPKCKDVIRTLKPFLPKNDYNKSNPALASLLPKVKDAYANAEMLRIYGEKTGTPNPATEVDLLVKKLQALRR